MRKLAEIRTTLVMYNDIQTHPLGKVKVIVRNGIRRIPRSIT